MSERNHDRLPAGVIIQPLKAHKDARGCFTEMFRREWETGIDPVQWNVVHSNTNVFRGVHLHKRHSDYLCLTKGQMILGLHDVRRDSPTSRCTAVVNLSAAEICTVYIPVGIAHGFYFPEPSIHVYSVSHYWDLDDELGCHWASPELAMDWRFTDPLISDRDRLLGGYESMVSAYNLGK